MIFQGGISQGNLLQYRQEMDRGGPDMLYRMHYDSPLGGILLLASEDALMGLWLPGQHADQIGRAHV